MRAFVKKYRGTIVASLVVIGLVGCFAVLASEVIEEEANAFDHAVLHALRSSDGPPVGPPWLSTAMANLSALGSSAVITLVVVLTSIFLLLLRRARHALLVVGCVVGAALTILILKGFVGRARPTIGVGIDMPESLSFPSGHSLIAAAMYPTLGLLLSTIFEERGAKVFVLASSVLVAVLVGFTRVYLGVHYPTDVFAGWLLGASLAITCGVVGSWLSGRRP